MHVRRFAVAFCILICVHLQTSFAREESHSQLPADVSSRQAAIVGKVDVKPLADGLAVEIAINSQVVPKSSRLTDPDRLVFDFPGCEPQPATRRIAVNHGPVQDLRLSLFSVRPPVTRVVIDLNEPVDFKVKPAGTGMVIEIAFRRAEAESDSSVSARRPVLVERESDVPVRLRQKQRVLAVAGTTSRPSAYSLLAKAKTLKVEDLQSLEEKAEAGDPEAETTLALAYHSAVLLKRDEAESLRLLHKAADQGFMAAQESLGIFAETGVGTGQPAPTEALAWYTKAARQGSLDAATNIALIYANGKGVPRDPVQAVSWFRQAAEGGDAAAQYNLALMYARGEGIPKEHEESLRWLTAAADQNLVPAILDLANDTLHPPDSKAPDVNRAIFYYKKAADLGNGLAQAILGNIFANGLQGKPDYEQAVTWYRKAAEIGQPDGQFGLGVRYALGQGVPVDLQEARRLFTDAADQGQVAAQFDLATMCEEGKGAPPDLALAAHYYQLAADNGMAKAQYRYGLLLKKNKDSRSDRVSAYRWLMLAQDSIRESSAALSDLRKSMDAQEIAEAEREVDSWRIAHRQRRQ